MAAVLALFAAGVLIRPQAVPRAQEVQPSRASSASAEASTPSHAAKQTPVASQEASPQEASPQEEAPQKVVRLQAIYVFYPGLTVEAERQEQELPPAAAL